MIYRILARAKRLTPAADAPAASIDARRLSYAVKELAPYEYRGRAPGTPGGRQAGRQWIDPHIGNLAREQSADPRQEP